MALFRSCIILTLGNGQTINFWKDRWINGTSLMHIAPGCYRLARRKNHTVKNALTRNRWMVGLQRLTTPEDVHQLFQMWLVVRDVQLSDQQDVATWNFGKTNCYTASSAYQVQFFGSLNKHKWMMVWKTKVPNKCKIFLWLFLQDRLWHLDRIIKHGGLGNPICTLCQNDPESHIHLMATCNYTLSW